MNLQETISSLLDNPQMNVDADWVKETLELYPYFTFPASLLLKRNVDVENALKDEITHRIALNASDRDALAMLIDANKEHWAHFYPQNPQQKTVSTNDAISTFLDNYGGNNPQEDELLEKLIFNPTPDYAQLLAREEENSLPQELDMEGDSQDALINAFILKSKEQQGHFPAINEDLALEAKSPQQALDTSPISSPEESVDNSMLSESLAKIYIKQHKYLKAYEIIRNLSLNFPEKSIYFADQLRFLQKLIINQRYIQSKNNLN